MLEAKLFHVNTQLSPIDIGTYQDLPPGQNYCLLITRNEFTDHLPQLEKVFNMSINSQHIRDALNPEHPSFYDSTSEYEMVIIRTISSLSLNQGATPELKFSANSYQFFCFSHFLIIIYDEKDPMMSKFEQTIIQTTRTTYKTPLDLLYYSLNFLIDQLLMIKTPINKQFKEWQKLMLGEESNFHLWNELINYKNAIDSILSICEDVEDTLEEWRRYTRYQMEQQFIINLNDLDEHIERAMYYMEKLSSNIDTLIQLHFASLSHRNNEILRVLAIISAIFLPLMLITGVFGMNFEHMPILQDRYAYYFTMISMFMLAIVLIIVFRIKRWL